MAGKKHYAYLDITEDFLRDIKSKDYDIEKCSVDELIVDVDMLDWEQDMLEFYIEQISKIEVNQKLVLKGAYLEYALPIPNVVIPEIPDENIQQFVCSDLLLEYKIERAEPSVDKDFTIIASEALPDLRNTFVSAAKWPQRMIFGNALKELYCTYRKEEDAVDLTLTHKTHGHVINLSLEKLEVILGTAKAVERSRDSGKFNSRL